MFITQGNRTSMESPEVVPIETAVVILEKKFDIVATMSVFW